MTNDPWTDMLKQFEPEYTSLQYILEHGPEFTADTTKRGKYWVLTIKEKEYDFIYYGTPDIEKSQQIIDWAEEQLASWPNVKRMAYDQWYFTYKKDIEKFVTLFNLKWAE